MISSWLKQRIGEAKKRAKLPPCANCKTGKAMGHVNVGAAVSMLLCPACAGTYRRTGRLP